MVGVVIAGFTLNALTQSTVQASYAPTTVEELPRSPVMESVVYFAIYSILISSAVIISKKVEKIRPRYKFQEPVNWHSI